MPLSNKKLVIIFIIASVVNIITAYFIKKNQIDPAFPLMGLSTGITAAVLLWYFSKH